MNSYSVNLYYAIMESPHRWWILAGIAFGAGCLLAIAVMTYGWALLLARICFYLGAVFAVYCLVRGVMDALADAENDMGDLVEGE